MARGRLGKGQSYLEEIALLYSALASKYGIEVHVQGGTLSNARARLYAARRAAMDMALAELQFRASPFDPERTLWITKGGPQYEEECPSEGSDTYLD